MKLSFWTLGTPGWSTEAVVEGAKQYGFDGVDLLCAGNGNISLQSSDEEVAQLKDLFASHGLEIASLLGYTQRGNDDGVDWDAVTADLIMHAELCIRVGTQNLRANVGAPARDSTWGAYLEGYAAAVTKALEAVDGVVINVQNHPGSVNTAEAGRLAAMVGSPRFGIGFSTDHCVDMGEDSAAMARQVAPWARHVHLADRARASGEKTAGKFYAALPGEGVVANREVLESLRAAGFDGWVSFKWEKPTWPELPEAEIALPRFVSFMRALQPA